MCVLRAGEMKRRRQTYCIGKLLVNHSIRHKYGNGGLNKQGIQETIHSYILNDKNRSVKFEQRRSRQSNRLEYVEYKETNEKVETRKRLK